MTGPEHYKEAERILAVAVEVDYEREQFYLGRAQVHATLALTAAAAMANAPDMPIADCEAWQKLCGVKRS